MFDAGSNTRSETKRKRRTVRDRLPSPGRLVVLLCGLAGAMPGCQSYKPDPIDPTAVLRRLNSVALEAPPKKEAEAPDENGSFDPSDGINLREAASLAIYLSPSLREFRAEQGIAAAQLIEAGLLPDPQIGWNAMDWLVGGERDDIITGFGLSWEVPRPGEIRAKKGIAKARVEEVRYAVMAAEWRLARQVALAWLEVMGARQRLVLNQRLLDISRQTHDYLRRGRTAKTVTALQENLASIELANVEVERERLLVGAQDAWQDLNVLLGLPPGARFELQAPADVFAFVSESHSAEAMVKQAIENRPDLKELLALYNQAEAALKLEIRRQWPRLSIGTGIAIDLAFGTLFNQPAIRTRIEERQRVRLQVEAAVHELRQEVHASLTSLLRTTRQLKYYRENLAPRLEESLRLSAAARGVTEITPVELLTSQRQVLETQTRFLETRIQHRKNRELVATLTGSWFAGTPSQSTKESKE